MSGLPFAPDSAERERAWSSPESVVVEASAGTGKTTLLIRRALWLMLRRGVKVDRLAGLAFNEKAAAELAGRLRKALRDTAACRSKDSLPADVAAVAGDSSLASLSRAAAEALAVFEKAHISTIHSFAATILRLYPAEAGVDPEFEILEEADLSKAAEREWDLFLSSELSAPGEREQAWRNLLRRVRIPEIREMALEAASFRTDIEALKRKGGDGSGAVAEWASRLAADAAELLRDVGRSRKAEEALSEAAAALSALGAGDRAGFKGKAGGLEKAAKMGRNAWPSAWDRERRDKGNAVVRAAKALKGAAGEDVVWAALDVLYPFAERARASLLKSGKMSYDALLTLARDLLRDNKTVRRQMKARFDAILLDEMQDVDPVQLEMILFLAEKPGNAAGRWEEVKIEPGRLFLVGDPKQSIYGFRNADLRACAAVCRMAASQRADEVRLATSMRSTPMIISGVNAAGESLFGGKAAYLALVPRGDAAEKGEKPLVLEAPWGGKTKAIEAEARAAAAWVAEEIRKGTKAGDVAVLFRRKGDMPAYASAFRRLSVPVEIEEERHFFRRTEIADIVNLLRVLGDPADEPALAGFLRGPWGGLTDGALASWFAALRRAGGARSFKGLAGVSREAGEEGLAKVFETAGKIEASLWDLPGPVWVGRLWESFAISALAAASRRPGTAGAVASFKALLGNLIMREGLPGALETLRLCLRAEHSRRSERPPVSPPSLPSGSEAESVRLLSVHQAKGLEFPVVILAGLRGGSDRTLSVETGIRFDWATGLAGAAMHAKGSRDAVSTVEGAYLTVIRQEAEEEEEKRLLYVAMTRARRKLVLMKPVPEAVAGSPKKAAGKAAGKKRPAPAPREGSFLGMLEPVFASARDDFEFGKASVPPAAAAAKEKKEAPPVPPDEKEWEERESYEAPETRLSPSDLAERLDLDEWDLVPAASRAAGVILGELCHRVLERWDFTLPAAGVADAVKAASGSMSFGRPVPEAVLKAAAAMVEGFLKSPAADALRRARILGREVPLLCEMGGRALTARADIIYSLDGRLFVGDYKTSEAPRVIPAVAAAYSKAAGRALGAPAAFAIISLKEGRIIESAGGGDDG